MRTFMPEAYAPERVARNEKPVLLNQREVHCTGCGKVSDGSGFVIFGGKGVFYNLGLCRDCSKMHRSSWPSPGMSERYQDYL